MPPRILIVKMSSLGDVIHTLPAAKAIRDAYPHAHLAWGVERGHAAVLETVPWIDELLIWQRGTVKGFLRFVKQIRSSRWDIAIDFQGLFRSGFVTRWCGARRRIGYKPSREGAHWFYNDPVPLETMEAHAVDRSMRLAAHLEGVIPLPPVERPYVHGNSGPAWSDMRRLFPIMPKESEEAAVEAWCQDQGIDWRQRPLVILNPHCRRPANCWPAENFTLLARQLTDGGDVQVALFGGPQAVPLCDSIAAPLGARLHRADGRFSLRESAALLSRAAVMVTGDTGPMHLAVSQGTRIVALFGASNGNRTGPYDPNALVIQSRPSCSPCYAKNCPLGQSPAPCQVEIRPELVYQSVRAQIAARDQVARARRSA